MSMTRHLISVYLCTSGRGCYFLRKQTQAGMPDTLMNGRKGKIFNVLDDINHQVLLMEVDYLHAGGRVSSALEQLMAHV